MDFIGINTTRRSTRTRQRTYNYAMIIVSCEAVGMHPFVRVVYFLYVRI